MSMGVSEPLQSKSSSSVVGKRCAAHSRHETGVIVPYQIITTVCCVWMSVHVQEAVPTAKPSSAQRSLCPAVRLQLADHSDA